MLKKLFWAAHEGLLQCRRHENPNDYDRHSSRKHASREFFSTLLECHKRGVKVQVILDKSQRTEKYSSATFLQNVGIPTFIDDRHAIAHNKVMVIDGATVITESFNFTAAAEDHNAENLLVIRDSGFAAKYAANWQEHLRHSVPYERPPKE